MKCPNCGFETESAFCQMCGTKISETMQTQKNEPIEIEYTSPLPQTSFEQVEGFSPQIQNEMSELEINQPPIPYIPQTEQSIDKKKVRKIVKIAVACVVAAVIIAGVTINILSASSGNSESIFGENSISDLANAPDMYSGDY